MYYPALLHYSWEKKYPSYQLKPWNGSYWDLFSKWNTNSTVTIWLPEQHGHAESTQAQLLPRLDSSYFSLTEPLTTQATVLKFKTQALEALGQSLDMSKSSFLKARFIFIVLF